MTQLGGPSDRQRVLDQQVMLIIRSGGGWNARTRARLAAFARTRGLDFTAMVNSALRAVSIGHFVGRMPAVTVAGETPEITTAVPKSTRRMELAIGLGVLLLAMAVSVALVWFAVDRAARANADSAARVEVASRKSLLEPTADTDAGKRGGADAASQGRSSDQLAKKSSNTAQSALARNTPPVPAMYSRPPLLRVDASPEWSRTALETIAAEEAELLAMQARIVGGTAPSEADRAAWSRSTEAFCASWPLLNTRRRESILEAIVAVHPRLGNAETRLSLRAPLEVMRAVRTDTPEAMWRGSGAAGLIAALDLRSAGGAPLAFGEAALDWLVPRTKAACDAVFAGDPARASDVVDSWLQATEAATSSGPLRDERDARIMSLIDMMLRRGAPLERPGISADTAGTLLDALAWTGDPARRGRISSAFRVWLEDPTVSAIALHGLTSVLAARRPGVWWEPWLVSGARADMADRTRTADHFATSLSAASDEVATTSDAPRIRGVRPELVDRWVRVSQLVMARTPAEDPAFRIAHAAELVAMVESARLLERGRTSDAEARIAQVEDPQGLAPDDIDRWKGRAERVVGRAPATDARLEADLRSRTSNDDKLALLRSLRTRAIGDLGPVDAATLAREALASPSPQLRSVAQGVIADVLASGPNMVSALSAEIPSAVDVSEAAALAGIVSGQPVPRGPDDRRRAAAMLLLLDHYAALVPSEQHRIDSVAQEFTLSANSATRALAGHPVSVDARPEVALRTWFDARADEARPVVPASELKSIISAADARRRLAASGPQAAVAELVGILELDAALLSERMPRRHSAIHMLLQRAAADRVSAPDVYAQLLSTSRALLEIAVLGIAPEGQVQ
ncbi:MAG: hypothetical protein DWH86_00855 [Planctomycetota bacterium]|nr:MAG: hypothetical protein DWH86_00855 [Planctomycetota bacterium]